MPDDSVHTSQLISDTEKTFLTRTCARFDQLPDRLDHQNIIRRAAENAITGDVFLYQSLKGFYDFYKDVENPEHLYKTLEITCEEAVKKFPKEAYVQGFALYQKRVPMLKTAYIGNLDRTSFEALHYFLKMGERNSKQVPYAKAMADTKKEIMGRHRGMPANHAFFDNVDAFYSHAQYVPQQAQYEAYDAERQSLSQDIPHYLK